MIIVLYVVPMDVFDWLLQAVPGPGKYDVKGNFDPEPPKVNTDGIEVEHPPFMSQAKVNIINYTYI